MHLDNSCFCGKTISITYSECVFVALVIQNAVHMRHLVICGLSVCTVFLHIISQMPPLFEKYYMLLTLNLCIV
jgi:hypothetical protein